MCTLIHYMYTTVWNSAQLLSLMFLVTFKSGIPFLLFYSLLFIAPAT